MGNSNWATPSGGPKSIKKRGARKKRRKRKFKKFKKKKRTRTSSLTVAPGTRRQSTEDSRDRSVSLHLVQGFEKFKAGKERRELPPHKTIPPSPMVIQISSGIT